MNFEHKIAGLAEKFAYDLMKLFQNSVLSEMYGEKPKAKASAKAKPKAKPKAKASAKAKHKTKTKTKTKTKASAKAKPKMKTKTKASAKAKPKMKTKARHTMKPKAGAKAKPKMKMKTGRKRRDTMPAPAYAGTPIDSPIDYRPTEWASGPVSEPEDYNGGYPAEQ